MSAVSMMPRSAVGYAAAGAGLCFLGYCAYFDYKRRSDPDFKKKLQERRRKAKRSNNQKPASGPSLNSGSYEDLQKFFLQEVQLGEELLATGDIEGGVEHLSRAVAVCGQPQQLLQVLQSTLPPQVFQLLVQKLPVTGQQVRMSSAPMGMPEMTIAEDDVE
ncbi:mitochondrial import receptor subunit TOM20 homolog [Mizuhopecten yessoensis]|uniref:Mitochondrial import receptor subunit TOM20-like n=1 Tax=Mizuhopecten yessoensis TaxID=6573 RepID=A0A210QVA9_MIZYE|nr:mitochondrial import receptor subunit TOM20 homolog [Mizuhopecten yessoensis]OWF52698.1 Mitochondrial import receptor subunit TOM20-like [Mizuhopecten yessoensis]